MIKIVILHGSAEVTAKLRSPTHINTTRVVNNIKKAFTHTDIRRLHIHTKELKD